MNGPEQNDWENDPVWTLVDDAKAPEAGPMFARNVMREIRLSEQERTPWWKSLLSPKPLVAGALAAAAAVAVIASLDFGPAEGPGVAETPSAPEAPPVVQEVDDLLNEELLMTASEDPSVFSDEALVAMLY